MDRYEEDTFDNEERSTPTLKEGESVQDIIDPTVKLNASLKTLQILGQLLKNFPGSLEADIKVNIVEACYSLGLRSLTAMFDFLKINEDDMVKDFVNFVRIQYPHLDGKEVRNQAQNIILGMARMIVFGVIKRISHAIGSPELKKTYVRMDEKFPYPSGQLVNLSLQLDHIGEFPVDMIKELKKELSNNPLAITTMRNLAVEHFFMFPVEFNIRQQVCDTLEISFKEIQAIDPTKRLVKEKI